LPGTITIPLTISNSPDIAALSLEIDYDGTVLSYLKIGGVTNQDPNLLSSGSSITTSTQNGTGTTKNYDNMVWWWLFCLYNRFFRYRFNM